MDFWGAIMSKFKVGDIVRCIEGTGGTFGLSENSIYTVISSPHPVCIRVGTDDRHWVDQRFELVQSAKPIETISEMTTQFTANMKTYEIKITGKISVKTLNKILEVINEQE